MIALSMVSKTPLIVRPRLLVWQAPGTVCLGLQQPPVPAQAPTVPAGPALAAERAQKEARRTQLPERYTLPRARMHDPPLSVPEGPAW